MTDKLFGEALDEYNDFMKLFHLYRRDAIDAFVDKYPMLKKYKPYFRCRRAETDYEECFVEHNIIFEITFCHQVSMDDIIALSMATNLSSFNHNITGVITTRNGPAGTLLISTACLELRRFYYSPLDQSISSF